MRGIRTAIGAEPAGRRRVLVCDDERHAVRLLQVFLERHGVEVGVAYDGLEALAKLIAQDFDLLVLGVMMPKLDGFQVLKHIRQDARLENLRVILVTAKSQDIDVFKGYHYGADLYLTKPLNPAEILALLR